MPHDDLCFAIGWCRYLIEHEQAYCIKHLSTRRNTQTAGELIGMMPDINDKTKSTFNPALSERNQSIEYMSAGSEVVQRLINENMRNYSGTSIEEMQEMFEQYGTKKSLYHTEDDVWDLI